MVELPNEFDASISVSRTFSLAQTEGARVTRGLPRRSSVSQNADKHSNGHVANGHAEPNGMDIDGDDHISSTGDDESSTREEEESDDEDEDEVDSGNQILRAEVMAVSEDGQWLAVADTNKKTAVYNLDVLKVRLQNAKYSRNSELNRSFTATIATLPAADLCSSAVGAVLCGSSSSRIGFPR